MRTRGRLLAVLIPLAAVFALGVALAQGTGEAETKPAFVRLLESMLSAPGREVRIDGLENVFSANPKVGRIAIADREGTWLELEGVEVAWTRSALLRRRLDVDVLRAARVSVLRRPLAEPDAGTSGGGFALPVEIDLKAIALPRIVLAQPVIGVEAEITAAGSAQVTADAMAMQVSAARQDRAGSLSADLRLEPASNVLTANVTLDEPAGGLIAELLDLRDRPAVSLTLAGTGPLDGFKADIAMRAGETQALGGTLTVAREGAAYRLRGDLDADLAPILPEGFAALAAGSSRVAFDAARDDDGTLAVTSASIVSDGLNLSLTGRFSSDLVPLQAEMTMALGSAGRVVLPFVPGDVSVAALDLKAGLDPGERGAWRMTLSAQGLEGPFGRIAGLAMNGSGQASGLADPASRAATFRLDGSAEGLAAEDPALAQALGSRLTLAAAGDWSAGAPVTIESSALELTGAVATFAGTATATAFDGAYNLSVTDLARFAGVAQRPIAGRLDVAATGRASTDGTFDLALDGKGGDLRVGIATLDPLLAGETSVKGGVARAADGLRFSDLALLNERVTAKLNGAYTDPALDLDVEATIADLALVTPRAKGAASVTASLSGTRAAPVVEAEARGESLVLMDRPLENAVARFSGTIAGPQTGGEGTLSGTFAGAPIEGNARLAAGENGARRLDDFSIAVGESRATGSVAIGADGLLAGSATIVSPDLSRVAPLFLVDAKGMLRAEVTLGAEGGRQSATVDATASDVAYEGTTLESAAIKGAARDLFGAPELDGTFTLRNLRSAGLVVVTADGTATRNGNATLIDGTARLADGDAAVRASLAPADGGVALAVERFTFRRTGIDVALAAPTTVTYAQGTARFPETTIRANGGRIVASGAAGSTLDVRATLDSVPAALVNAFQPNLGAEGTVSGTLTATGTATAPQARFDLRLAGVSVAASRNAGIGAVAVTASGNLAGDALRLQARATGADGLALDVNGEVATTPAGPVALTVRGAVPLALGNTQLAARGAALQGALDVNIAVSGTSAAPRYSGRVTSEGGGFVDPDTGIVLRNLSLAAAVSGDRIVVERLNAQSGEGSVAATGSVGLDPNAGFPVDLRFQIRQARYVDGTLVAARFDADLTLTGTFAAGPLLSGTVFLDRTEVTVPERIAGDSIAVDVRHVAPPPPVARTLAVLKERQAPAGSRGGGPGGIRLDIAINAPQQIFVRGRGLDTELGGDLRVSGQTSALVASGGFTMVRGRLDILTQRIEFSRGVVTFAGDLDPLLEFSGTTRSGDVDITVSVTGRASNPDVSFSSVPELPQDEILARLVFQRGLGELSPLQIARLAAAASELSSGQGGLLNSLRASTGLDNLDIVTDESGAAALAAGRYVSENVYVGVQQGMSTESSRVTIDLDVTKNVKARAGMSGEGNSSLGVFYEREY